MVGLTGGIGHGKTTFADLLSAQARASTHFETWELVAEVAMALCNENVELPNSSDIDAINQWLFAMPEIVALHAHATLDFNDIRLTPERLAAHPEHYQKLNDYLDLIAVNPELADSDITDENKDTFRPLLQWVGGYLVAQVGAGVWYDELLRRINLLRGSDSQLVTVGGVRYPGDAERLRNNGAIIIELQRIGEPDHDSLDITERERIKIVADCIVQNDSNLDRLERCAHKVYTDLATRHLQQHYAASKA